MRIGIDLGGTKIAAVALDATGAELARVRVETPKHYDDIVKSCADVVRQLETKTGKKGSVGIGAPGAIDSAAGIIQFSPNVKEMAGKPFAADVGAALQRGIRLANDAQCFALSEAVDGAGQGAEIVYGVILGTGVGGGLIVGQKIPHGANSAREWGHVPLPWADEMERRAPCGCGRIGCIEALLSGPALHRQLAARLGHECSNDDLLEGLQKNNVMIKSVVDTYITRLAKACAMLINILDPSVIVLGGGVSNIPVLYDEVPKRWQEFSVVPNIKTRLLKAKHGDDSGLRGAAWLWPEV